MVIMACIRYIEMDAMKGIDRVLKSLMKYSSFFEVFKGIGLLPTVSWWNLKGSVYCDISPPSNWNV